MKETPWFFVTSPPFRTGEYEICFGEDGSGPDSKSRRLWDGRYWKFTDGRETMFGLDSHDKWRGLKEKA